MAKREIQWTDVNADLIGKRLEWTSTHGAVRSGILTGVSQRRFKPFMVTFEFENERPLFFEPPRKKTFGGMTSGGAPPQMWVHED